MVVALILAGSATYPNQAVAALALRFPNGGTAQLQADGTITGTAHVGDPHFDTVVVTFDVTMPDGTITTGECLDHHNYVPAPGDFPFVATPTSGGRYLVTIDSSTAKRGTQPYAGIEYLSPAQRVGEIEWEPTYTGWLKITKTSTLPAVTTNNDAYQLKGAHFSVYSDPECTALVDTTEELVTNELGETPSVELPAGTYWVKEDKAPTGFHVAVVPYQVSIADKALAALNATDTPIVARPEVWATKTDAQIHTAQGSSTLEGAQFVMRFYAGIKGPDDLPDHATRTWVVKSDNRGNVFPSNGNFVSGGTLYYDAQGNIVLPCGVLAIQEVTAPEGYLLEGQSTDTELEYEAPLHIVVIDGTNDYEAPVIEDYPLRGGIALQKTDAQTGSTPQGDATFEGIAFSIINRNEQAVVVDDVTYGPGEVIGAPIVTNSEGKAATPNDYLPLGTYEVVETSSNGSYLLTAQPHTISLNNKSYNDVIRLEQPFEDEVVRGGIAVGKISHEVNDHLPQGEATLKNAVFSVTLQSKNPVVVNGSLFHTGDIVTTLSTNDKGVASTSDHALPYGTYLVQEIEAPTGYLLNTSWSKTVRIQEDGVIYNLSSVDDSTPDQVKRGGFTLNKVDELTKKRMSRVPWRITSDATGESHILVTGDDGVADTERCPHTARTNANDAIVREDGSVDEELIDPTAGIWFAGCTDMSATIQDDACALPYDAYTVEELRSSANEGHELVSFRIRVHADKFHAEMGDIVNRSTERPTIGTTLTFSGNEHVAPATESVTLTDVVSYKNLPVGEEYHLVGTLMDKEAKQPLKNEDGSAVTQTITFTPVMPAGAIDMTFELNTSTLSGHSLVAVEELFKGDERIAWHDDLDDLEQTVAIPSIGTSLTDADGNHEIAVEDHMELIDTVEYHNLLPNVTYELQGTLIDKDMQEVITDEDGQELHGATSFVPTESDGTAVVSFMVNRQSVAGRTVVAFESLTRNDVVVATHNDPNAPEQTVRFADIQTEFTDTGAHHAVPSSQKMELIDTVTFRGLEPGSSYLIEGTLMDKRTGEALTDAQGKTLTASTTFVPTESVGSTSVSFVIDTSICAGTEIVAFETLYQHDRPIAIHADLEDRAQTVHVPAIQTTLTSEAGMHETKTGTNTLTDVIAYKGIRPNIPYTIRGVLVHADTGEPLTDSKGNELRSVTEFTPESPDGETQTTFELDASSYEGQELVAYEYLYEGSGTGGRLLASHEDKTDRNQTVTVPFIATTACDATDGDKTVETSEKIRIRDTVSYKGLEPGASYDLTGTIYRSSTQKPLQTKDGNDITAQASFTPEKPEGVIDMEFEFDAELVGDEDLVVFESCTRNGIEVASHADASDKNQTVHVKKSYTPPEPKKVTTTETPSEKGTTYASPSTGDATLYPIAGALTLFGGALLLVRRVLF